MRDWNKFISKIQRKLSALEESGCDTPFFRGHSRSDWKLLCGLGRKHLDEYRRQNVESILYYDYMSLAGPLLQNSSLSWDILFSLQHYGLPTRLLDWTMTFSVALYFAVKKYLLMDVSELTRLKTSPCVWILDPFELNHSMVGETVVLNPQLDFEGTYKEIFIENSKKTEAEILAINTTKSNPRLAAQKGVFTLHSELFKPLEAYKGKFLTKYVLPTTAIPDAIHFLTLAGMNEFTLFPDLDGLARHLRKEHVDWS